MKQFVSAESNFCPTFQRIMKTIKTTSQVPLIQRLAREGKEEEMDIAIFEYQRLTMDYEDLIKNHKDPKFLKHFEYEEL